MHDIGLWTSECKIDRLDLRTLFVQSDYFGTVVLISGNVYLEVRGASLRKWQIGDDQSKRVEEHIVSGL